MPTDVLNSVPMITSHWLRAWVEGDYYNSYFLMASLHSAFLLYMIANVTYTRTSSCQQQMVPVREVLCGNR